MIEYKKDVLENAIKTYGIEMQLIMMLEECAELQKEVTKYIRGNNNIEAIAEEIADVSIVISQLVGFFNIEEEVQGNIEKKIDRLEERIDQEPKCRVCGCTHYRPCDGGCSWVEVDLCSNCI